MGLIHLYPANTTVFTNNGTPLVTAMDAVVKRDEGFQLTFKLPIDQNGIYKTIQKEMIVRAMTPDGMNYFRIWDMEKHATEVIVTALQLLYTLDKKQVNSISGKKYTGTTILGAYVNAFKSSIAPYTFSSSISSAHDFYTNEENDDSTSHNALAVLNKITDVWGGELLLNGFDVRMISKLGTKTDALLYEYKNIASFSDSSSVKGLVTRIYATSTFTPEKAEGATEDPKPVVLNTTVDSPLINQYSVIYEAYMTYNDARTIAELKAEITKQYSEQNVDKPERTIDVETNIIDGTVINFGDELVLKYLIHDVDEVIRCVGYEYDPISENYIGITLGTLEKTFLTKVTEGISNIAAREFDKLNKKIQIVQSSANGKNRVTYGPNPVPNPIEGDLWFHYPEGRPDEIELLIYQNGLWLPAPFLTDQDKTQFEQKMSDIYDDALAEVERKDAEYKEIFDGYDDKVEALDQEISDAGTKAEDALAEAGISSDLAQTAKDLADTAKIDAQTAISNAQSAIGDASIALTASQNAELQVGTALSDASQAIASANIAKTNAQTALTNAQTALTEASGAKTTVNSLTTRVDEVAGEVESKASQTTVDGINGTISDHSTTLTQHATLLSSKAEASIVNTIKGTVDTHTTEIRQNATDISSKASTTSVNTLSGTVSEHTTKISQNATAISARLTGSQVNSIVDGKGFTTATYVDNKITATANGIKADLTKVEGKIPQSYTEENLVLNSKQYVSNTDYLIKEYDLAKELTVGKEYTIVLEGGIGSTGSDQQFGIFFDNGGSSQVSLVNISQGIYKATFTLLQTGTDSGDKSKFRLYNLPQRGAPAVIKWIKLVEGKAKDNTYRPSMNELLMENDFTVFKGEYEVTARSLSSRLTAIDSEGGRLSTAETRISQNATAIEARLTRSEVDTLVDGKGLVNANYVNTQITTTADGIKTEMTRVEGKIPQSYTEENLVLNSKEYVSNQDYMIREYTLTKQLVVGKEYTIVLDGGIGSNGTNQLFGIYFDGGQSAQGTLQFSGGGIYKKTFTLVQSGVSSGDKSKFRLYNMPNPSTSPNSTIRWIKLVEGSVTDNTHTLSMSDLLLQNDFTVFKNTTEDTIEAINTELSKTAKKTDLSGMVTESVLSTKNYVTAGTMTTTLTNYAQTNNVPTKTQFNDLKNSYDSMVQTIGTDGNKIAQMVMTDSLFSTKVLASVEIGGRNYAVGTTDKMQYNQQILEWSGNMQANTSKNVYTLVDLGAKVGDTYTASIYIAQSGGFGSGLRIDTQSVSSKYVSAKAMHNFATITFTVEEGDTEYRFYYANTSGFNALYKIEACKFQIEKGNKRTDWNPSPLDKANQSQVTQLAGSWALSLRSGGDIKTSISATTDGIRLASKLIHLSGETLIDEATIKSAHIYDLNASKITGTEADFVTLKTKVITTESITSDLIQSDEGWIDKIFSDQGKIDYLWNKEMWSQKINAITIDAGRITGETADFISAGFKALNSQSTVTGHAIRIQNIGGEFVEMNNTPELRSDDARGTAVVLGNGRVHFYDSRGHSKGYVGVDMHTAGSHAFGTFLSKGSGIYKFARMADATQTTYAYYTVKAGITTASPIITDMVRTGLLPDGNAQQFVAKGNMISELNGWPNYPNWPALSAGQKIRYKELTSQTTGDAYEDIWKFGPSTEGDWRIYFAKKAVFEGGTTGTSDRRIKHAIAPTQIEALRHIDSLTFKEFKWNRDNAFEPLGLIAQDSGILRVPGGEDEMEGIDIQRAIMLALKGIQELQEEIKHLREIINQ